MNFQHPSHLVLVHFLSFSVSSSFIKSFDPVQGSVRPLHCYHLALKLVICWRKPLHPSCIHHVLRYKLCKYTLMNVYSNRTHTHKITYILDNRLCSDRFGSHYSYGIYSISYWTEEKTAISASSERSWCESKVSSDRKGDYKSWYSKVPIQAAIRKSYFG